MGSVASQVIQTYDDFIDTSASYLLNVSSNTTKNNGQVHDDNLETVSLLWLDADVNTTEENRLTQLELRQIINHLKTFDDQQQCHQHILSIPVQDRVILVVSGRLGRQLVPQIHHLRQISSIYVYCMDKEGNERWAKDFTKIKSVIVRLNELTDRIKADQQRRMKDEEPLLIEVFKVQDNPDQSTTELNGHLVHFLLLIDVLIRIKSRRMDKRQLITRCETEYQNNESDLALVHEFQREYSADKALWWYTRDSFVYRLLNKALRVQNIDLLFLFRFFIADVYQQLKQNQCQSPVRVYRGQVMSDDELNTLRRSIGEFISINSFFSTSFSCQQAKIFSNDITISKRLHRVLFEINADPSVVTSRPFADISGFSYFHDEREVLFMAGSIFRIIDIHRDDNEQPWVIQMKLCGDNEYDDLKKLFDHLKKEYGGGDGEVNLHFFGDVLHQMGKYDLAEKMYCRLLDELPANDPSLPHLYRSFGMLTKTKAKYDSSLEWFHEALNIKMQTDPSNYAEIADLYKRIGIVHSDKNNYTKALEYYNKAIELFRQSSVENQLEIAHIYHNIGIVYKRQEKYLEALGFHQKSLSTKQVFLPAHHPSIAMSHNNIGNVYLHDREYDLAMEHYKRSLNIRLKSLPSQHPDIAMSYRNIAVVHESKYEWKQALIHYEKSITIYRHSFSPQHPHIIQIESDIQRVSSRSK